ncbi:MAG: cytochrome P450 [Prochloraceae cyanobacterium]
MKNNRSLPLPPGDLGLPIIGPNLKVKPGFRAENRHKYGDIFKTRFFGMNFIYLYGKEANRFILSNENIYFVNSSFPNSKTVFGTNTLTWQRGEKHKESRKILFQAFNDRAIKKYLSLAELITEKRLEKWSKLDSIELYSAIKNYTFDLNCQIILGIESASQTELVNLLKDLGSGIIGLPIPLPQTRFGRALGSRKKLLKEIEEIIVRHKNKQQDCALDILLKTNSFSDRELKEQIINLIFLGHRELTSALSSFCVLMAKNPKVLDRINTEQEKIADLEISNLEKIKAMTYLETVIKEVLRLFPPVPGGNRKVIQECSFGGYKIPKNWYVTYDIKSTHQDPEIYSQPDLFLPERFNLENQEDRKQPYSYIPFGGGLRECLGKELALVIMKIFASTLVSNYSWKLSSDSDLENRSEFIPTWQNVKINIEQIK